MLYYDRIDISKATDLSRSNKSTECIICHYWFFNYGFKFQDYVYNGCHNLTFFCLNISDITIITVKIVAYRCIIHNICLKVLCWKRVVIYKKYCLNFQSNQVIFYFILFV